MNTYHSSKGPMTTCQAGSSFFIVSPASLATTACPGSSDILRYCFYSCLAEKVRALSTALRESGGSIVGHWTGTLTEIRRRPGVYFERREPPPCCQNCSNNEARGSFGMRLSERWPAPEKPASDIQFRHQRLYSNLCFKSARQ